MSEKKRDDGGPAFGHAAENRHCCGATLRDYFAIHGDQPGQLEMAAAAGITTREYCGLSWVEAEKQKIPTWVEWFHALPQSERYALYAKVRYQIADAMIAERSK